MNADADDTGKSTRIPTGRLKEILVMRHENAVLGAGQVDHFSILDAARYPRGIMALPLEKSSDADVDVFVEEEQHQADGTNLPLSMAWAAK